MKPPALPDAPVDLGGAPVVLHWLSEVLSFLSSSLVVVPDYAEEVADKALPPPNPARVIVGPPSSFLTYLEKVGLFGPSSPFFSSTTGLLVPIPLLPRNPSPPSLSSLLGPEETTG